MMCLLGSLHLTENKNNTLDYGNGGQQLSQHVLYCDFRVFQDEYVWTIKLLHYAKNQCTSQTALLSL